MHPSPPNILRSTVMGCKAKYEMTKKRCQGAIFLSEIEVFGQEKGVIYVIYQISDKIESEKGRQKFWAVKWIFSLKQVIRKFPSPQSRRQVSANGLSPHWLIYRNFSCIQKCFIFHLSQK